jgi:hypothetical protein
MTKEDLHDAFVAQDTRMKQVTGNLADGMAEVREDSVISTGRGIKVRSILLLVQVPRWGRLLRAERDADLFFTLTCCK